MASTTGTKYIYIQLLNCLWLSWMGWTGGE